MMDKDKLFQTDIIFTMKTIGGTTGCSKLLCCFLTRRTPALASVAASDYQGHQRKLIGTVGKI